MKLHLPNSAHLQNIDGFLSKQSYRPSDKPKLSMHHKWVSAHPAALALLASIASKHVKSGGRCEIEFEDIKSLPYLIRMGLFDFFDCQPPRDVVKHEQAGRFLPISNISSTDELENFLVDMVPLLHAEPSEVGPVRYVISELVRNVLEHAASNTGAIICAQYYKKVRRVAIAVADCGIGVKHAMAIHQPPNDWEAIRLALQPGITGVTKILGGNDYNAGAGLFFTKAMANCSRTYFIVYSGSCLFKLKTTGQGAPLFITTDPINDHCTIRRDLPSYPGTLVSLDISTEQLGLFKNFLKFVRKEYGSSVTRGKKQRYRKANFS